MDTYQFKIKNTVNGVEFNELRDAESAQSASTAMEMEIMEKRRSWIVLSMTRAGSEDHTQNQAANALQAAVQVVATKRRDEPAYAKAFFWLLGTYLAYSFVICFSWNTFLGHYNLDRPERVIILTEGDMVTADFPDYFFHRSLLSVSGKRTWGQFREFPFGSYIDFENPSPFMGFLIITGIWAICCGVSLAFRLMGSPRKY